MKTKKIISICARALSAAIFSGCTGGARKTPFSTYWNQNALVVENIHETLVYDVTFEGSGAGYSLSYANGVYKTELKSAVNENGENIYVYKTELSIDVTFALGEESKTLNDSVSTEVTFLADSELRPLSSQKSVVSHTPVGSTPSSVENAYRSFEYQISTSYTEEGGISSLTMNEATSTQEFEIDEDGYSYLDNEQLLLSLRAMPASVSSTRLSSYSPFVSRVQNVAVVFSETESKDFSFYKNGSTEKVTTNISYRPVQFQLNEKDPGATQTAWIAAVTDAYANQHRNVMLRLQTPIAYGLGTLVYQLSSASYQ